MVVNASSVICSNLAFVVVDEQCLPFLRFDRVVDFSDAEEIDADELDVMTRLFT